MRAPRRTMAERPRKYYRILALFGRAQLHHGSKGQNSWDGSMDRPDDNSVGRGRNSSPPELWSRLKNAFRDFAWLSVGTDAAKTLGGLTRDDRRRSSEETGTP